MAEFYKLLCRVLDSADDTSASMSESLPSDAENKSSEELKASIDIPKVLERVYGSNILEGIRSRYADLKGITEKKSYVKEMLPVLQKALPSFTVSACVKLITSPKITWVNPQTKRPVDEDK